MTEIKPKVKVQVKIQVQSMQRVKREETRLKERRYICHQK